MRGLPPPPPDVIHLEQTFDAVNTPVSIGFWLLSPGARGAFPVHLRSVISQWFTSCLPSVLELLHAGAIPTTCRASIRGVSAVEAAPPSHGAWSGGQADNVAMGLKWSTGEGGRRGWALTYIPAVPDIFVTDNYEVSQIAWGNLQASGQDLYNALNALVGPFGAPIRVGTVHTQISGVPMTTATFSEFVGVTPTAKVVTIARRIPSGRRLSPF